MILFRQEGSSLRTNLRFALSDRAVAAKRKTWSRGYIIAAGTCLPVLALTPRHKDGGNGWWMIEVLAADQAPRRSATNELDWWSGSMGTPRQSPCVCACVCVCLYICLSGIFLCMYLCIDLTSQSKKSENYIINTSYILKNDNFECLSKIKKTFKMDLKLLWLGNFCYRSLWYLSDVQWNRISSLCVN